jgi:hypothetical protein
MDEHTEQYADDRVGTFHPPEEGNYTWQGNTSAGDTVGALRQPGRVYDFRLQEGSPGSIERPNAPKSLGQDRDPRATLPQAPSLKAMAGRISQQDEQLKFLTQQLETLKSLL